MTSLCHWYGLIGNTDDFGQCATRAAELYVQRLRGRPKDAELLSRLGNLLYFDGVRLAQLGDGPAAHDRLGEADRRLIEACKADPNCWAAWLTRARMCLATGQIAWAEFQETTEPDSTPSPALRPQLKLDTFEVAHRWGPRPHTAPVDRATDLIRVEVPPGEPASRPAESGETAKDDTSRTQQYEFIRQVYWLAYACKEKAFAIAPNEPAVRLYRVSVRVASVVARSTAAQRKNLDEASAILTDPENLVDLRAALAAKPDDIDLIGFVDWH